MKSALLLILFTVFSIDVSGADVKVSVMVGDSVTLHNADKKVQTEDVIKWDLNGKCIAVISEGSNTFPECDEELKARLQPQSKTGDLQIRNIKTKDSGDYKLEITTIKGSSEKTFSVSVVPAVSANAVKSVIVMEGDSVTLKTDIQTYDVIQWRFGNQNSLVAGSLTINNITSSLSGLYEAEISNTNSGYTIHHTQSFNVTVSDHVESVSVMVGDSVTLHTGLEIQTDDTILWKFGDHGQLTVDLNSPVNMKSPNVRLINRTGNLMISNITSVQSGDYKVEINSRGTILHKKYNITMIDGVKSVSVVERNPVTLQIGAEIQNKDVVLWIFGDTQLAKINKADQHFPTSVTHDERFRNRLELDHQTGSLIIKNTTTTDSGDYELKINSSRHTINRRISVAVTGSDDRKDSDPDSGSCLSPGAAAGIAFAVILGAAAAVF